MNQLKETLINIIYPRRCPVCHEIVKGRGNMICPECRKYLLPISEPRCKKCGKQIHHAENEFCDDCSERQHAYLKGIALLPYEGKVKESIYQIKYHNKREYLDFYGEYTAEFLKDEILSWEAQAIIPVPLHRKKMRNRGFNQAELLGKKIGKRLNIPVRTDFVERIKNTIPQKQLLFHERQNNLKGAFKIKHFDVELKKIIIVDDIYTTGSTIDEMAGAILACGAEEIYFVALCIGRDNG